MTFANFATLTFGDSATGTGTLHVGATSSVLAGGDPYRCARRFQPTGAGFQRRFDRPDQDWLHHFSSEHDIVFNDRALIVENSQDVLKVGAGFDAQLTPTLSSYVTIDWGTNLDGERYRSLGGSFGVRVVW